MTVETGALPLIRTKLYRPRITGNLVPRPRLLERLEGRRERPLSLVVAPAGYGKTTLVATWLEACACPSAWLSLDEGDDDLVLFLTYLLAALQTMFPDVGHETLMLLKASTLPPLRVITGTLINELDQIESPFVLALDDYHHVRNVAVHDLLAELCRHPPRPLHLVLVSRRDPLLPLASLRARRQVTEIRSQDLRFTERETAAFVEQELGTRADDIAVRALLKRVEGWVTGMRLIILSLRQRDRQELSLARLRGSVSYVTEYLVAEVLERQPRAIQDHLLNTAILDRFCAPLCEAMSAGQADRSHGFGKPAEYLDSAQATAETDGGCITGQAFVKWLVENDPFLVRLDDHGEWYRYHHIFQEFLRDRLEQQRGADGITALHSRASAWFAQNHLIDEALQHAMIAGDVGTAARLVAQHRHQAMNQERWHRLRHWLGMLPRDAVENDPRLLIVEAWLLIGWAKMADVAERVGALLASWPPESADTRNLEAEFDTLQSLISYHIADGPRSLALAQRALENLPREFASERGLAVMLKSMSYQMLGDLASARSVVWEALTEKSTHHPTYHARVLMTSCFLDAIAADLNGVLQSAKQVLQLGQEQNLAETIAHGYYFLGLSHYERNELVMAEQCLLPVVRGAYIANLHNFTFSSFLLALTYQAQDRPAEAREVVEAVVDRATETGDASLLQTVRAFEAELAIRQGNFAAAHLWAGTFSPEPFYVAYRFYVPQITLPRVLLTLDTFVSRQQADDLLSRLHDFFGSIHNIRLLIEVLALQALLHDAQNDESAALATLKQAIALAEPGGFIRIFVDLGPRMAGLLVSLSQQVVAPEYTARILAAFRNETKDQGPRTKGTTLSFAASAVAQRPSSPPAGDATGGLLEPLTPRELEVLALLAQGLKNKEIARQLVITPGTVKQHTHHIYQKLDVKTRWRAVTEATALGILLSGLE